MQEVTTQVFGELTGNHRKQQHLYLHFNIEVKGFLIYAGPDLEISNFVVLLCLLNKRSRVSQFGRLVVFQRVTRWVQFLCGPPEGSVLNLFCFLLWEVISFEEHHRHQLDWSEIRSSDFN